MGRTYPVGSTGSTRLPLSGSWPPDAGIIRAVWLVVSVSKTRSRDQRLPGRELLEERYAPGEISCVEYLKKKHYLEN